MPTIMPARGLKPRVLIISDPVKCSSPRKWAAKASVIWAAIVEASSPEMP
jgi:hypothetical protein